MSNWNTRRESHTRKELEVIVGDAKVELEDALWRHGEGSRPHTEAVNVLRIYQRRLDDVTAQEAEAEREAKRSPKEIATETVDKIMGDR